MKLKTSLISIGGALLAFSVFAADIPQDNIGAQKYDRQQCLNDTTQTCINSVCLNSDQIDCQDNCRKLSESKCQQQNNE